MIDNDVVVTADEISEKTVDATAKSTVTISAMSRTSKDGAEGGRVTRRSGVNKMAEYIDRQAAIDAVGDVHPLDYNSQAIVERLKNLPPADVAPVRRGYWIGGELGNCSVCGHHGCASDIWTGCWAKGKTFCPACGALLDDEYWDEEDDDNAE